MLMDAQAKAYNRLKHEKSPYLLQHADNPVDWYPWGDGAFKKAEGGFYVWRHDEVMHILKKESENHLFEVSAAHYGIKPDGNVSHDPSGNFPVKIYFTGFAPLKTPRNALPGRKARLNRFFRGRGTGFLPPGTGGRGPIWMTRFWWNGTGS